ncbi:DNA/RNA non-specific endonuclease [Telluribacter sp.]|jgi:endonuclease G|uniref:DNA/RNA non-specific endonuclease n=1 Tax=Telluribacter sp. TaxID=1978767 RepID=UPI002E135871|nr:DNA/RNA non-specific endonuclease [Telluribacter sp.]
MCIASTPDKVKQGYNEESFKVIFLLRITAACKKEGNVTPVPEIESIHLSLGNPTAAKADTTTPDNYLMLKEEYALSYNRSKRHANWVAWELSNDWIGSSDRQDNFRPNPALPAGWYRVVISDYTNSGFDGGHLCPSADRTNSDQSNAATFLMTNIIPQAPQLNREAWARLEDYCRDLVGKGYRLFIVAGVYGTGGEGSAGSKNTIRNSINVPARNYKVIVAIPGGGGIEQINASTPVIAVDFPNVASAVNNKSWGSFVTTPGAIEKAAGVDFFTYLPVQVSKALEAARFDPTSTVLL